MVEYDITNTEEWFTSRSKLTKPKRLRKVKAQEYVAYSGLRGNSYKHTRTGLRTDLGVVVRSGWEADSLRILKSYAIDYVYEPKPPFIFPVAKGNKAYLPDAYLPQTDEYIEVKGFFSNDSRIKLKRFKKYYPEEFAKLTIIINKSSKEALRICRELEIPTVLFWQDIRAIYRNLITNWESN